MPRLFAALALALLAPSAAAQVALVPGSPELAAVAPQSATYEIRLTGTMERTIGRVTRTERVADGRLEIVVHAEVAMSNQDTRDTTLLALPSMALVAHATHRSAEEFTRVRAADGRLVGSRRLGNLREAVDAPLDAGVFGPGTRGVLVRSLPFAEGYTATARTADAQGMVTTDTLRVLGTRPVTRPDGSEATAWEVSVADPTAPRTTYLVDAATRELLATRYTARPGVDVEIALPAPPPAGPVVRPGDAALDLGRLGADEATFELRVLEPVQTVAGRMTVRRTLDGDSMATVTTLAVPMQGVDQTTTAVADRATLAPRTYATAGGPEGRVALAYAAGRVTGTRTAGAAEEPVDRALDAPAFDAAWLPEVVQALPLAEGYTATVALFDAGQGPYTATLRVTGTELDGAAAWTVDVASAAGGTTYTVDAATRRLLRIRLSPQPGVVIELVRQ